MKISFEQLVETVVREVVAELKKQGVEIAAPAGASRVAPPPATPVQYVQGAASVEVDMSSFKSPVLTENQITRLGRGVGTIVVPCRTVVTPGAWDVIRSKKLTLVRKAQSHR